MATESMTTEPTPDERLSPIPLSQPSISDRERSYVADVLSSTRLSFGPYLEAFEARMAERCGTAHAVAVSSGTAALHCIVRALGLSDGDEVITTPYSFVASSNALLFEGVTPVFVDIDPATFNIDPAQIEAAITPRTRGILAVDVFGMPAPWPALHEIAEAHDLVLIDDACEAIGADVGGRAIGQWGDAASFGFYPNKQVTTGEGGCITTDSGELADLCRSLRNQGRGDDAHMRHVRLGFNYRLSELPAAVGCAQLDRLDDLLGARAHAASLYADALAPLQDMMRLPVEPSDGTRSWFVYVVQLADAFDRSTRDDLLRRLRADGIGCAPYFPCIHLQPYYRNRFGFAPGDVPVTEHVAARTLAIPFFPEITAAQIDRVADVLSNQLSHVLA
jgi:perosamine synthetase